MAMNKAEPPITKDYLTIVALEDGLTAKLSINACEYCVDGDGNWKSLPADTETETVNSGQTLSFRGNLKPTSNNGIGTFTVNKFHNLKGNCMSMLFGDDGKGKFSLAGKNYAFKYLFKGCDKLVNTSTFILPATTLEYACYYGMFSSCTNLINTPELPSSSLADYCYYGMFANCSSITIFHGLSAETAKSSCYAYMFNLCTSLITPPELYLTKLANSCCYTMFGGCFSLRISPILHSTILAENCYARMFEKCKFLNKILMFATDISLSECLTNWVSGVASEGTFVKSKDATWNVRGASGIPNSWEVITE